MTAKATWRCRGQLIAEPGVPAMRIQESAYLPCGCTVHLCRRLDDNDGATGAVPCSPEHNGLIDRFNADWKASLYVPTDRLAIDVIVDMLNHANLHWSSDASNPD